MKAGGIGICSGDLLTINSNSSDFSAGRGGGFGDYSGYIAKSGEYYLLNNQGLPASEPIDRMLAYETFNSHGLGYLIVLGEDTDDPGVLLSAGSVGAIINSANKKYPAIIVIMKISDKSTMKDFETILSTFKFNDMSAEGDNATWQTYTNPEHGYAIKYPPSMRLDTAHNDGNNRFTGIKGEGLTASVMLRKNSGDIKFDSYYYMDNPINSKSTLGGKSANVYIQDVTNSGCITSESGPECPGSFVAYVAINGDDLYHLEFYGDTILNDTEKEILSSFKFID